MFGVPGERATAARVVPAVAECELSGLNPIDIAAVLGDWTWELTQLEEGQLSGSGTILRLDPMLVGRIRFNRAVLQRIRCPPDAWTLIMRGSESSCIFAATELLRPSDCVVLDAGTEIELLCHGAGTVIVISQYGAAAQGPRAPDLGKPLSLPGRAQWVRCGDVTLRNLLDCIDAAEASAMSLPSLCLTPDVAAWLVRRLRLCLFKAIASVAPIHTAPSGGAPRRAAVERARLYIHKHLTEPIRLADLCKHAYVQHRSLEYGFREVVGLSPMAYIRALRLAAVHRRLLSDAVGSSSISQVALDTGFHHLGQFASDYKRLFLENPSTTRKRARLHNGGAEPQQGSTGVDGPNVRPSRKAAMATTACAPLVTPATLAQHLAFTGARWR